MPALPPPLAISPNSSLPTISTSCSSVGDYEKYCGVNWYFKGMPVISEKGLRWIYSRTGQHITLHKFLLFTLKSDVNPSDPRRPLQIYRESIGSLPDERTTHAALEKFLRSRSRFLPNVVDPVLFKETIRRAYDLEPDLSPIDAQVSGRACVWALLAVTSRPSALGTHFSINGGQIFADKAQACLELVVGRPSLDSLQAYLMVVSALKSITSTAKTQINYS